MYWHFIASLSRRLQLDVRPISDKPQVRVGTSGQSISTKRRIAPALVTPAAGESILKPRFRRDALLGRTNLQPRAAVPFAAYMA